MSWAYLHQRGQNKQHDEELFFSGILSHWYEIPLRLAECFPSEA